jgi:dTDP-glucose 4,6-dehydratase
LNQITQDDLKHISSNLHPFLDELNQGHILITGATGFFGIWMLETFKYLEEEFNCCFNLHILSRNPQEFLQKFPKFRLLKNVNWYRGDIRSFVFPENKYSHIIHGATTNASETYEGISGLSKFETIVDGTRNLLNNISDAENLKFLYISSGSVFQNLTKRRTSEFDITAPNLWDSSKSLGNSKRTAEFLCTLYSDLNVNIEIKIARCFSFIGPYVPLNLHYAIGNFISDALNNKPIRIKGDGRTQRSYMYMTDLVVWLINILVKGKSLTPYNVGSEESITIKNLAKEIRSKINPKLEIVFESTKTNKILVSNYNYIPSTTFTRKSLGLIETNNLDMALDKTIQFYKTK